MQRLSKGDCVRVDIPDEADPDHDQYHGSHGKIVAVLTDDASAVTGDTRDEQLYRVVLNSGKTVDFRWRDLRPPFDEDDSSY